MKTILIPVAIGGLVIVSTLANLSAARAETIALKTELKAFNEVPPNDSKATGTVTATYDSASKELSWTVVYSGLTGAATAAHFHGPAEPGKNAGIMIPIPNVGANPAKGTATLTDAQAADLLAGRYYVNIHTAAHPGGEIRGQVIK
jgi:hypothetical protein